MKDGDVSYWLEAHRLGVMEQQLQQMGAATTARARKSEFIRIARLFKDLKLIPKAEQITAIALGVNCLGERGVLINCTTVVQLLEPLPLAASVAP